MFPIPLHIPKTETGKKLEIPQMTTLRKKGNGETASNKRDVGGFGWNCAVR